MKAVIFDMDGVIFDTEPLWKATFPEVNKKYNIHITEEQRLLSCGMNSAEQYKFFLKFMPEGVSAKDFFDDWEGMVLQKISKSTTSIMKEGFLNLHKYLRERKIKLGLNSGSPREMIEYYFQRENLDINKMFDFVISGDDIKHGKPHPEGYQKVCQALKEKPEDCIVLEDSLNGVASGFSAGCEVIMVLDLIHPDENTKNKCKFIAKSLKDVEKYIKNMQ